MGWGVGGGGKGGKNRLSGDFFDRIPITFHVGGVCHTVPACVVPGTESLDQMTGTHTHSL